ncbi:hypothetical protein ID866_3002 [Astraeus odoratus]|nr:hypothetical protein ID866_3002 [Astraeus odoratus]
MDKGNAHEYVQNPQIDPRPLIDDIAQGLHYLHTYEQGEIIHGDLKGANVLISPDDHALLTDFGLSYFVNSSLSIPLSTPRGGTLNWMPPEILDNGEVSAKADVWSFGMTCLELFSRKIPFHDSWHYANIMKRIVDGSYKRPNLETTASRLTDDWWDMCVSCCDRSALSRPPMSDIVKRIRTLLPRQSEQVVPVSGHPQHLSPTTKELLSTGIGKSSLINRAFGIEEAVVASGRRGIANIDKELVSKQNDRFILHDSQGLEPGETENYSAIKSFIKRRSSHTDIKEQLHAIWFCFQIPLSCNGERLIERGMEEFLKKKREVFGNVPTIFVFTKYDKLIDVVEGDDEYDDEMDVDYEAIAENYLRENCVKPIEQLTQEKDIPYIAVTTRRGYEARHGKLIQLTFNKVSEHFTPHLDEPSPVPVVTLIAQRVVPSLKIEGWEDEDTGGRSLAVRTFPAIRYGIAFRSFTLTLYQFGTSMTLPIKKFRELMVNMVGDIGDPAVSPPTPTASTSVIQAQQRSRASAALVSIKFPFSAGLNFVNWVYNTYQRLPVVQEVLTAYIVDLTHVLKTLFTLTTRNSEKALTRKSIKTAFKLYHQSALRSNVHANLKNPDGVIAGRDVILEKIESLVKCDDGLIARPAAIPTAELDQDEPWHTTTDDPSVAL